MDIEPPKAGGCPFRKPPKPTPRADRVSLWQHFRLFRRDILSAQPERLYRAWMAEFKTPFFSSYMCNDPELIDLVLKQRPQDFPKSDRIRAGLEPLLGRSVFVTNGAEWQRQRRIIDPAFEGGRLRESLPAMQAAAQSALGRMHEAVGRGKVLEIEEHTSHAAADVIFRTLFSLPIEHVMATRVFEAFQAYQRSQPLLNIAAFVPVPKWFPKFHRSKTKQAARLIRDLIRKLTHERAEAITRGIAPLDLATKIMTTPDPVTGACFSPDEMVDQVAIFFLAGHETSASALAWTLYLLALYPEVQESLVPEARAFSQNPDFSGLGQLRGIKDVFREALRLYPPVPMMVREAQGPETLRERSAPKGAQIVLSPWHLHRHERLWDDPDEFCPMRWGSEAGRASARQAYMPFSAGERVCPGAGFAMIEGQILLAHLLSAFRFELSDHPAPEPVAHLTVRAKSGIWLRVTPRQ